MSNLTTNIVDHKYSKLIVFGLFSVTFTICLTLYGFFGYLNKGWIHGADAEGFYMVARSIYFDHDVDIANEIELTLSSEIFRGGVNLTKTGKVANQMPIGYALLVQPFLLLSDIITRSSNYLFKTTFSNDGYGGVFSVIVPFATMIYGFIGIYTAYKVIIMFFNRVIAAISINSVILSSSLLWYITGHVTMVHIHSFTIITILIHSTLPFFNKNITEISIFRYACIGALLAFAVMIRLQNAIFAIIPIVAMVYYFLLRSSDKKVSCFKLIGKISIGAASSLICFVPQMLSWKSLFGSYIINSYGITEAYFDFFHPELVKTLFSTNHGLFLWNPITLISCLGMCLLFYRVRTYRLLLLSLFICFILNWFLIASWSGWWLANSFGNRGFDGSTLFFALGWAEILNRLWHRKKIVITLCVLLVSWNLQLLMQQRYLGWLPIQGDVPYLQVFKSYEKLPDEWERIKKKYFL